MRRPPDELCRPLNTQLIVCVPRPLKTAGAIHWRIQGGGGGRGNSPPHSTHDRAAIEISPSQSSLKLEMKMGSET